MNILLLGKGKTGSLVGEIARERGHRVRAVGSADNRDGAALTLPVLRDVDVVIDFTTPHAVVGNIEACVAAGSNMAVGTTGWYSEIPRIRSLVEKAGTGLVFAANFSVGVNLLFEATKAVAPALREGYSGRIVERHHVHKKDKPSGTAVALNNLLRDNSGGGELPIDSVREGEIVGEHLIELVSANDILRLEHLAISRRGFAEGAVRTAEWLKGRKGFYDFKDIFRQLA
ncbi:MAG TPA: dihydrodipicolinate reductase C-terminal domain-containing protein [Terriglobales bacterium]|nr:dihydrodipicolinate reductase C-terminal domain-containing protein [Terriglobales bacterium]